MLIRQAAEADLPALLDLYAELHPDDPRPDPAAAAGVWAAMAAHPGRTVLVAEVAGAVVGTADCAVQANLTRGARSLMLVENVVVTAGARRTGVGARLLAAAVGLAREAGCYKVQLLSRDTRADSHAFYEAQGFAPLARGYRVYLE